MKKTTKPKAFTLIELIVTISIISLLIAIMLPALSSVRRSARQTVCSANLRGIMQSVISYTAEYGSYPPAYIKNQQTGQVKHFTRIVSNLYATDDCCHCPSLSNMGLPPLNTTTDNLDQGQISAFPDVIDDQPQRCSYTANQALFPEDKFSIGIDGVRSPSRFVADSRVKAAAETIALTEWSSNWLFLQKDNNCHSYLPVHGFCGIGTGLTNKYDLNLVDQGSAMVCRFGGMFREVHTSALSQTPKPERIKPSRLDWVGRNHGNDNELTNFAYADGHVEAKTIFETVDVFQWGKMIYSIQGGRNVVR